MINPLPVEALRWTCDPNSLAFASTDEVEPSAGIFGQSSALDALRFGLECSAVGQNVFVRGLRGSGRLTMVRRLLAELNPVCKIKKDRCYVQNFSQPDRPRLVTLPPTTARPFRRQVRELAEFVATGLGPAMNDDSMRESRRTMESQIQEQANAISAPMEKELADAGLALVSMQANNVTQTAIFPLVEGKPVAPEQLEALVEQGAAPAELLEQFNAQVTSFKERLETTTEAVSEVFQKGAARVQELVESTARRLLRQAASSVRTAHDTPEVHRFLDELVDDVIDHLGQPEALGDPRRRYRVNALIDHEPGDGCPSIIENAPNLANLLGTVEPEVDPQGSSGLESNRISAGSLLRADGGYLIIDATDLLSESGSWKMLLRTLRTGTLEIIPPELGWPFRTPAVKPEPIPISVRVILLGDSGIYHGLDQSNPDFADLFKVLADFDQVIPRDESAAELYAGALSRIAKEEGLPAFDRTAIAALVEHGSRIAARSNKLTARFGRVADIAREAAFLSGKGGEPQVADTQVADTQVTGDNVRLAVRRTKERANLPSRRFQEFLANGTITVETAGEVIGQINGMAVINAGPLTYGFPARITATIGAGSAGIIDIESSASMSGSIHTKGFHILGGLLRHLLPTDHPLAFSASLTFEQSYGGIDGDSASGAEICCLLSALTGIPIKQGLAMTGAIDQHGRIQAIGGVNEKLEGFFDTCQSAGLTGEQGALIPRANAGDLMLRDDVVDACRNGKFRVFAVSTVQEALEILTGVEAGEWENDAYPDNTVLHKALKRAHEFWLKSVQAPAVRMQRRRDEDG